MDRVLKQVTALLSFAQNLARSLVGKPCDQSLAEATVKNLLLLASTLGQSPVYNSGVPAAVQSCLGTCMQLLSAQKFLGVVLTLLKGQSEQVGVLLTRLTFRISPSRSTFSSRDCPESSQRSVFRTLPSFRTFSSDVQLWLERLHRSTLPLYPLCMQLHPPLKSRRTQRWQVSSRTSWATLASCPKLPTRLLHCPCWRLPRKSDLSQVLILVDTSLPA